MEKKLNLRCFMYYHLDIDNQIRKIMSKVKESDLGKKSCDGDLVDITDGELYKNLLASEDCNLFKNKSAFSLTLNTDGISPYKHSNLAIWPVYLVINELPLETRFSIDNTILAGKF